MELALLIAREPERLEQLRALAGNLAGHQLAHPEHLVAVIGIGDDIDIVAEHVEHREAVGREAADPAGVFRPPVEMRLALETLLAMGQHRAPALDEFFADHEVGTVGTVGIDRHRVRLLGHHIGR